ncbi:hypothetical protein AB7Z61_20120 [Providencia rettgeri]
MKYLDLDPFSYGDNPEEANKLMELELRKLFDFISKQLKKERLIHILQENIGMNEQLSIHTYCKKRQKFHLSDDVDLHYLVNGNVLSKEDEDKILEKAFKYRSGVYISQKTPRK